MVLRRLLRSEGAGRRKDGGDVAGHPDLAPSATHDAGCVDQKGAALDAHIFAAIHAFFDPGAVLLAHIGLGVGSEEEGQVVLLLELVVRCNRIFRYPDHHRIGPAVIRQRIAESAGLGGAAGGVILRVEIEHHFLALQLRQGDAAVAVGGQGKIGGFVANLDTHRTPSPFSCAAIDAARRAGSSIRRSYQPRTRAAAAVISASRRTQAIAPAQRTRVAASGSARVLAPNGPSPLRGRSACTWRSSSRASSRSRW